MSGVLGTGTAIFVAIAVLGCIFTGVSTLFGALKTENWRCVCDFTRGGARAARGRGRGPCPVLRLHRCAPARPWRPPFPSNPDLAVPFDSAGPAAGGVGTRARSNPGFPVPPRIAAILTTCAVFCLWLMWVTAYLHQLNPLIAPDISAAGE